jgi:hypothetical protein
MTTCMLKASNMRLRRVGDWSAYGVNMIDNSSYGRLWVKGIRINVGKELTGTSREKARLKIEKARKHG